MLRRIKRTLLESMSPRAQAAYQKVRFTVRPPPWYRLRTELAKRYLEGDGLEIGALHMPTPLPVGAAARYVDYMSDEQLRLKYRHLTPPWRLVEVDIVDDGETLASVADASANFVVAHHMIEHTENPIGTIETWLRVTRTDGVLMIGVPNREQAFDRRRPGTDVQHTARDYLAGPAWSRRAHYREWCELVEGLSPDSVSKRMEALMQSRERIHFHTWTPTEFCAMLEHARRELGLPFQVLEVATAADSHEFQALLKRT